MSGVKHTPGPWHWVPSPHATHPDMGAFFSDGGQRVCWFGDAEQYYPSQGEPPSDADARLIAAAPDLLDALREARDALHQHYVDWDGEPEDAVPLQLARAKCDAAIAKATAGETRNAEPIHRRDGDEG